MSEIMTFFNRSRFKRRPNSILLFWGPFIPAYFDFSRFKCRPNHFTDFGSP